MPVEKGTKMGGRGCPRCGGHNTEGVGRATDGKPGVKWCLTCKHRWFPCTTTCRGYKLEMKGPDKAPAIMGCELCGVPDRVARYWPEAYRAMAMELQKLKDLSLASSPSSD